MFSSTNHMLPCPPKPLIIDRRWKGAVDSSPNCPRCDSPNTKFCYYNNYSLTQPRYFCKGCRRYWTKGGSLRNVPVGGGCRKSRRGKLIRVSTDQIASGSSSYGCTPSDSDRSSLFPEVPLGNSFRSDENSTPPSKSDAPAIDLALLYSKFLNQQRPDSDQGLTAAELPSEFDPSFDFSNALDPSYQFPTQFSHEHQMGEFQQPFDPVSEAQFIDQFYLNQKEQDRIIQITSADQSAYSGMQGSPSQAINRDILWPAPPVVVPQPQEFESVTVDHFAFNHSNLLNGNWNAFDLPNYQVLFSKP